MQALAAIGITGPAAVEIAAQARQISPELLRSANALIDQEFSEERLRAIAAAVQLNTRHLQMVRDLVIDDAVEPAPLFLARGR
jgi:hypothetical protein